MARMSGGRWVCIITLALVGCGKSTLDTATPAAAKPRAACATGLTAFQTSVFPLVRSHCVECHDTGGIGKPSFAVSDMGASYDAVSSVVNFDNIPQSIFVVTGGNFHCKLHGGKPDCGAAQADILTAVNTWWSSGEKSCNHLGALATQAIPIPGDLVEKPAFQTLRWDLGTVDATLAGTFFEVEAQHFADPSASSRGAYRFRLPRIATADKPVFVKGVKIAVNSIYDVRSSTYMTVRQTIDPQPMPTDQTAPLPYPSLSPFPLIVLQDNPTGDTLAVAFDHLNVSTATACKAMDKFQPILDLLEARGCYDCHGGGSAKSAGTAPANQVLNMNLSDADICGQALQRMDRTSADNSVFISGPLRGSYDHPVVITSMDEVEPAWTTWVNAEIAQ